jgi:NAD(P)-dependent dehydrogenase (short-subunit alcohol dehydrogenase family)
VRRIMVTGATGGIGRELVLRLAAGGDQVLACGRSADSLRDLPAVPVLLDLSGPEAFASDPALTGLARLDALVHSAGTVELGTIADTPYRAWIDQLTVNLAAAAELTRVMLPALRAAAGRVVFVNSGAGKRANAGWGAYAASKHGLVALADALRAEEPALKVTTVFPGRTATQMQQAVRKAEGGPYEPETYLHPGTVAEAILAALDSPADAHLTELVLRPS